MDNRLKMQIDALFLDIVKGLVDDRSIESTGAVFSLLQGYEWEQIVDPEWFPAPRY